MRGDGAHDRTKCEKARAKAACGKHVDEQWKACGYSDTSQKFYERLFRKSSGRYMWMQLRSFFRLRPVCGDAHNAPVLHQLCIPAASAVTTVHRFEETINGRAYKIEVSAVTPGKWRAQIARVPGGSRALMPFYGRTPDEAAQELSRWLTLAHARSAPQV